MIVLGTGLVVAVDRVARVPYAQLEEYRFLAELLVDHRRVQNGHEQEELLVPAVRRLKTAQRKSQSLTSSSSPRRAFAHLRDRVRRFHVHAGVHELGVVRDFRPDRHQHPGPVRDAFSEPGVERGVLVQQTVVPRRPVHVYERRAESGRKSCNARNGCLNTARLGRDESCGTVGFITKINE